MTSQSNPDSGPSRRGFFRGTAALYAAGTAVQGQSQSTAPGDVTRILARYLVASKPGDLPENVRREGVRTLVNWVGCALGGSREAAVSNALAALTPLYPGGKTTILGRREKLDPLHGALLNGISSHVLDFDDTHLKTVIHPAGPVAPALLALAEQQKVTGAQLLHALVLGCEVECRIGNAVYPAHYDIGWHITGSVGPFGAAVAAGKILGLNEEQMRWALGLAASQPVGLREMFGSMTKSFHSGRAAQNGLTAALLAAHGFTSSEQALEAKRGWARVLSTTQKFEEITGQLGQRFELLLNTYKPFACGIVTHPTIDGCIGLRAAHNLKPDQIERVDLAVHPLVEELTGKPAPAAGLEGKFSIYYIAAVALMTGAAGPGQFTDKLVRDSAVNALREKVHITVDKSLREDQGRVSVRLTDGRILTRNIEHAVGSVEKPMTDTALDAKFLELAAVALSPARARKALDICRRVESLTDAAAITKATAA